MNAETSCIRVSECTKLPLLLCVIMYTHRSFKIPNQINKETWYRVAHRTMFNLLLSGLWIAVGIDIEKTLLPVCHRLVFISCYASSNENVWTEQQLFFDDVISCKPIWLLFTHTWHVCWLMAMRLVNRFCWKHVVSHRN